MKKKKTIVTHIFPDLDAITAVWLLKRFDSQFEGAEVKFVPAGSTWKNMAVDSDPEIIHVDTGKGKFDHHETNQRTCAAELVFEYLKSKKLVGLKDQSALVRLIEVVLQVDHFEDFNWPKPASDRYDFCLHHLFDHLKMSGRLNDKELISQGMLLLEAVLFGLKQKIKAEAEMKKGQEIETIWGRTLAVETKVSRVAKLGQKMGFNLVVIKEPEKGFVSLKSQPKPELDLTKAYQALKEADKKADWFFHASRHIILNGSRHNDQVRPSNLSLSEIVDILKKIS